MISRVGRTAKAATGEYFVAHRIVAPTNVSFKNVLRVRMEI